MFGGDEVNAIVVDIGACTTKAGYAGEDTPKAVFPSYVGALPFEGGAVDVDGDTGMKATEGNGAVAKGGAAGNAGASEGDKAPNAQDKDSRVKPKRKLYIGIDALSCRKDNMEVVPVMKDGLYGDLDIVEGLWETAFKDRLRLNPSEHPMMLAEPSHNEKALREKIVEMMFELHGPPALFLAKNAALSSFSVGRQTSLIMDCGYDATTVAAVHDGYVLQKSVCRAPLGGATVSRCMQSAIEEACGVELRPRYMFKRKEGPGGTLEVVPQDFPATAESYKRYMQELIAADIKETLCRVTDGAFDEEQNKNIPTVSYELPDGQEIQVGSSRFKVPEVLFQPNLASSFKGMEALKDASGNTPSGLPQMVLESINKCDVDVRKELCSGVVLTGGSSLIPQLRERIEKELTEQVSNARVKVMSSPSMVERKFGVWIGGSILASLGSFQQMWMSKADYQEHGTALIHRKAP